MTTAPMGDEELSELRENIAAMIRTDGALGIEDQIPALLARLDAAEANARRMREALNTVDNWLVCAPITTAEDFRSVAEAMHETVAAALKEGGQ